MTNINQVHNLTPPFAEAPSSVDGLKGFEPGSLILGGEECIIYNSRRSSIINGKNIKGIVFTAKVILKYFISLTLDKTL